MSRVRGPEAATTEIRPATAQDVEAIVRLDRGSLDPAWSRPTYEREITRADALLLVAVVDRRAVGFLAVRRGTSPAEILRLAVESKWRRQGLARRLVDAALREMAAQGIDQCWLELREDNAAARALYASLGFRVSGRRAGYYGDGADAVLMSRDGL